jgi:hypothetical protein
LPKHRTGLIRNKDTLVVRVIVGNLHMVANRPITVKVTPFRVISSSGNGRP